MREKVDDLRPSRILPSIRPLRRYYNQRVDPLTNLFLVLPLFLAYHLGVLTQIRRTPQGYAWIGNGVDFLTGTAMSLSHGNPFVYAAGALLVALVLGAMILYARRRASLHPRLFVPVLVESSIYAIFIAGAIGYVVDQLGLGVLDSQSFVAQVIAACGAGLHEELVFRVGLFGGTAFLLERRMHRGVALLLAGLFSSAVFSAVHYLPPLGDRFTLSTFTFRLFCGAVFALVYRTRGFAIAAWTHTLYDVLYFALKRL